MQPSNQSRTQLAHSDKHRYLLSARNETPIIRADASTYGYRKLEVLLPMNLFLTRRLAMRFELNYEAMRVRIETVVIHLLRHLQRRHCY